jgi:hypothetical protein
MGDMVRVFDVISTKPLSALEVATHGEMFPPVFVGVRSAVKRGRWRAIGVAPVPSFDFPKFRSTSGTKPGVYANWWLWDGRDRRYIGILPAELRSLELEMVWGDELLEERIVKGRLPMMELL